MFQAFRTFLVLPLREKIWFVLLLPVSGLIRGLLVVFPFQCLVGVLGHRFGNREFRLIVSDQQRIIAWRIGRIIQQVERFAPWEVKCFSQALMARLMCGVYGVPYVVHLGVRRVQGGGALKAHAWLAVGPWIVVGREGHRAYTVVSTYAAPGVLPEETYG